MGGFLFQEMKVSIIGLGWLGLPLAHSLQKKGIPVIGSTTSEEKRTKIEKSGIPAVRLTMNPHPEGIGFGKLFDAKYLVINIPPRSKHQEGEFYLEQLKYLKSMANESSVEKVIFVSSTSVYPESPRKQAYQESDHVSLENTGNKTLYRAEELFRNDCNFESTILRLGGLMGGSRIPVKYFAGKENVIGHTSVNFIHQIDAVGIIDWIISENLFGETFNGVAPKHPQRKAIYEKNSQQYGMKPPESYTPESEVTDRLISSEKIQAAGYQFKLPDPLDFYYDPETTN